MALQPRQGPFQVAIEPGEVDALINLLSQEVERKGPAFADELGVGEDELPPELGRNRRRQPVGVEDLLDLPTDVGLPARGCIYCAVLQACALPHTMHMRVKEHLKRQCR